MKLVMKILTIGIDVSKSKLDFWTSENKFTTIDNDELSIVNYCNNKIFKSGSNFSQVRIVLESTGKYHRLAHKVLSSYGFEVMVINPYQSRNFSKAMNLTCKTDKVDAKMLCAYGQNMQFNKTKELDSDQELLMELSQRKYQLQGDLVREINRLKVAHKNLICSIEQHIVFLRQQITSVEQELEAMVSKNPVLKNKLEILTSAPGVGKALALTLLSCLPELGSVSRNQISALTGLAPINNDSGKSRGKRSIQKGRSKVRHSLYMPILSAIRSNPIIKRFYHHLKAQGKQGKVAITACMRKLITILNLMLKNNTKWNVSY